MQTPHKLIAVAAAGVVAITAAGSVIAADTATEISVTKTSSFLPGENSPGDAPVLMTRWPA